ncbi:hypothetical protein [Corynebacterium sp.]|nr:hypothetical protein [Corynebacterium sp.]
MATSCGAGKGDSSGASASGPRTSAPPWGHVQEGDVIAYVYTP